MKLPDDAGAVVVEMRAPGPRTTYVVFGVISVVLLLIPAGDPSAWPVTAFYFGIFGLTAILLGIVRLASRRLIAVCEHGLVVRRGMTSTLVPWASVRALRSRWRQLRTRRVEEMVVETTGKPIYFGFFPGGSRAQHALTPRAVAAIQERTQLRLQPGNPSGE